MTNYIKSFSLATDTMAQTLSPKGVSVAQYNQGDVNTDTLNLTITHNNSVMDLTGATVSVVFSKPDGKIVYQDTTNGVTVTNATQGQLSISLNTQTRAVAGVVVGAVRVTYPNNQILETEKFSFNVEQSLASDQAIASVNDVSGLIGTATLTTNAQDIKGAINEVNANVNSNTASLASMAQAVYAKKYVVGDGTTDDTTALKNAIAAVSTGGTLIINCPIYVTDTITFNKRINVICVNGGVIIPSGHSNTAVVIGDVMGVSRYADMDINLTILGGASSRNYGLILQNISNSRIKATVMCGSSYGVGLWGMLVNKIKIIVSSNYPSSYLQSFVMPSTAHVHLLWSAFSGGYTGGNNANKLELILEGGQTQLLIDNQQSQGDNYIKGTLQGGNKAYDITNTFGMTLSDLHIEASTQDPTLTTCLATKINAALSGNTLSLVGCIGTTIDNVSAKNVTIDSACKGTVINGLTLNGGTLTDSATDTQYNCPISYTNQTTSVIQSVFSVNKNGVNQTAIANNTATIVQFPNIDFDVKTEFLTGSGVWAFKPKKKGKYRIGASVQFATSVNPQNVVISIYKNSALYKSAIGNFIHIIADVSNPNNDYFQVYITQTTGASVDIDGTSSKTYFFGGEF